VFLGVLDKKYRELLFHFFGFATNIFRNDEPCVREAELEFTNMKQILASTITLLPPDTAGGVLVTGSHGGLYPGQLALAAQVRAAIFNDAGVGKDNAGIASLALLQRHGRAAAAVSHTSARIGDTDDMMAHGVISAANDIATACGVVPGMRCTDAAARLEAAPFDGSAIAEDLHEARTNWTCLNQQRAVILADSASLVGPQDAGAIIVTGSHGGLIGGDPKKALRADAFAAVFNDAGIGKEDAGTTRLPALDKRGIAAFTVAASSARIGDAHLSLHDGIISRVNRTAAKLGAEPGQSARDVIWRWATR
jgi:hypothetical protein